MDNNMILVNRYSKGFMTKESILPDFQKFLRYRKLVPDKNIPYFAHWTTMIYTHVLRRPPQSPLDKITSSLSSQWKGITHPCTPLKRGLPSPLSGNWLG